MHCLPGCAFVFLLRNIANIIPGVLVLLIADLIGDEYSKSWVIFYAICTILNIASCVVLVLFLCYAKSVKMARLGLINECIMLLNAINNGFIMFAWSQESWVYTIITVAIVIALQFWIIICLNKYYKALVAK